MDFKPAFTTPTLIVTLLGLTFILNGTSGQPALPRTKDTRLLEKQLLCALDRGPCDSLGEYIKGKYN